VKIVARNNDGSDSDAERSSRLEELANQSELPVAVNVRDETGAVTDLVGWFPRGEAADAVSRSAAFLQEVEESLLIPEDFDLSDAPREVRLPDGSSAVHFDATYGDVAYYGCGARVTVDEALNVRALSCRWPTQQVRLRKRKPSAAKAIEFVRSRARAEETRDEAIPEPELAIWDPATIGAEGDPEPVFVFRFGDAEQPADVLVDLEGSTLVDVVTTDPTGNPAGTFVTPRYHLNPATGVPDFVSFEPNGLLLPEAATGSPVQVARAFFVQFPKMFGTADPDRQLALKDVVTDADVPATHVVFEQRVGPYPVYGCELHVHLTPSLAIRSISGNYMRIADVPLVAAVDEEAAHFVALGPARLQPAAGPTTARRPERNGPYANGQGNGRQFFEQLASTNAQPLERHGLVILPLKLARDGGSQNHLAWWFSTPQAELFVSATDGTLVYEISNRHSSRFVFDAQGDRDLGQAVLELVDGVERVAVGTLDPESRPADNATAATEAFWRIFGRNGWDGGGGNSVVYVEANFDDPDTEDIQETNAAWQFDKALFARNFAVPDVVGHELTHGLIRKTADLRYKAESGAINESYADVFGELIFPNADPRTWQHGVGALPGGAPVRDLAKPTIGTYAQYLVTTADNGGVHSNSGIGSKAAVLLCDGDGTSTHPGIGRQRLARLYWDVLTTRLHPWSSYIDVLTNTWQAARDAVALRRTGIVFPGTSTPGPSFDGTTPAEVLWAFRQVGLDLALNSGWFEVPGSATTDFTFFQGVMTPPDRTVSDVEARLVRRRSSDSSLLFQGIARVSTGGTVSDPTGAVTATIISSGVGTRNMETVVRVTTPNFELVEVSANVFTVQVAGPPAPPPTNPFPTNGVTHWFDNPFFLGRRYGDIVYQNTQLPAGNTVTDVVLELMDRSGAVVSRHRFGDPGARWGQTGASIFSRTLGGTGLEVRVRSWHDFGWAVRYRLVYFITGVNVTLPPFALSEVGYEGVDPLVVIGGF
jgi:Zn-dependent metalloprotease